MGNERIGWRYDIRLLTNRFMLWDTVRVIGLSVVAMYVLVAATGWIAEGEPVLLPWQVFLGAPVVLLVLMVIAMVLLGNRHGAVFEISPEGVSYKAEPRERRINRVVATVGALLGSPSTAGAGMLAMAQEEQWIPWGDIEKVVAHPRARAISLADSWHVVARLYCPPELYDRVLSGVTAYHADAMAKRAAEASAAAEPAPARRSVWFYAAWIGVTLAALVCAHAWYWADSEVAARLGVVGALCVLAAGISEGPGRRIFGVAALILVGWHATDVISSAAESFEGIYAPVRTATLDTGLLALNLAALALLFAMGVWRTFGRVYEGGHR